MIDLVRLWRDVLQNLCFKVRKMRPCVVTHLKYDVSLPEDDGLQLLVVANVMTAHKSLPPALDPSVRPVSAAAWPIAAMQKRRASSSSPAARPHLTQPPLLASLSITSLLADRERSAASAVITPMDAVPGARLQLLCAHHRVAGFRLARHLGNLNLYFIKENVSLRVGQFPEFVQGFLLEMQAICRAHVVSRGGNALVSYKLTHCQIVDSPSRNQGQVLLMLTGDVVELRPDEPLGRTLSASANESAV